MSAEVQESGGKNGKSKQKKFAVRVDFTPMVDMNMLLITFFMLCTTLSKPQTMEISMPSNDKNITEEQKSMVKASQAITLLLGPDNKLYYYEGEPNYKDYTSLKETTYGPDGLRSILLQKNATAVNKVRALKQQKLDLKISDEEYKKQVSEIKSGKDTPTVIIKATDDASYMNLIDALDEMQICNIGKHLKKKSKMAKIDLTSQEWCQLIFEGKNQAYGAYKMRANSTKRHNLAMLAVLVIALIGFTIPTLVKLATPKQKEVMTEVTTLSKLAEPEIKQEEMKRVEPVAPPPPALKSSIKFTAPVIKKDEEVHEDNEIKSQEELTSTKVAISIADVKGNDEANGKDIADLKQVVTQAEPEPEKVFDMVEQMPTFPGGQQELMSYLGKNIKYPTIAQENGTQGRVIIQFVVERDGSITDVRVARGVDPYLDKEAVRVVKSMPKWIPGKQNGKAVRVKFTVPVMFRLQ